MEIQFGLETEVGITREDASDIDVVAESINLVRQATAPGVKMQWDYAFEDPHLDARGFRVKELRQDSDEVGYLARDTARKQTYREIKSDYVLKNGARFYNDHAHPEYCTPECSNLFELLVQDRVGEELLMACAEHLNGETENPIRLFKNNTDFQGHSYGCHENYLFPRQIPWDSLARGILPFLVTRQIFCGAGKFGFEEEDRFVKPGFQISQRSDFFSVIQSVDTMQQRPIINTRDEPHADPSKYRRFHVIVGDANMSPFATWLKVGSTALVLQALAREPLAPTIPQLRDPVSTIKGISRDTSYKWAVESERRGEETAISLQRRYIELVDRRLSDLDDSWRRLMESWAKALDDLQADPLTTADRLDWSAKFRLLDSFREAEGIELDDPWLRSLDLAYHLLNRENGLYYGLEESGQMSAPYPLEMLSDREMSPPKTTRAAVRGRCIEKFGPQVDGAQWDFVRLKTSSGTIELDLRNLFDPNEVRLAVEGVNSARRVADLARLPFARML